MTKLNCKHCGGLIHLGRCGAVERPAYLTNRLPTGEVVVRLNGVTVATGFDSQGEAQEWIDEQ